MIDVTEDRLWSVKDASRYLGIPVYLPMAEPGQRSRHPQDRPTHSLRPQRRARMGRNPTHGGGLNETDRSR